MPDTEPIVRFSSTRFGDLEVPESRVINIPDGIIGFPDFHRYAILDPTNGESIFLWLHSVEESNLAFIIADPLSIVPGYAVESAESDLERIGIDISDEYGLFVIVTVPPDNPDKINANLVAPIIYRKSDNSMHQIVLEKGDWPLKYFFLEVELGNESPEGESDDGGGVE